MDIQIESLRSEQKLLFVQLMQLYYYERSPYENLELGEKGYYEPPLEENQIKEEKLPYLIRVDNNIAGFLLLGSQGKFIEGENTHRIDKFFILLKYRNLEIDLLAAKKIFDMYRGQWEVDYLYDDIANKNFWTKIIKEYTKGSYITCSSADKKEQGFYFNNEESQEE